MFKILELKNADTAVPAEVSWAAPRTWKSSQYLAVASQNLTRPCVTGADPAMTVAVSVTTVPDATDVAALPPLVMANVVVVAVCAKAGRHTVAQRSRHLTTLPRLD